ncbi:MAG: hypothetical protein LC798_10775 [Chloroflexi bacterium]|nr:hypothetical protein [Chloroflexota bacterium]
MMGGQVAVRVTRPADGEIFVGCAACRLWFAGPLTVAALWMTAHRRPRIIAVQVMCDGGPRFWARCG